ncbi:hypothetical protein [Algivirga pacifica]|uniref:Uncharacterized protein n=1 Tax=Algivirga pacifica TaxID=1162670 RepID=A0ABP9D511_9BACT
MMISNKDRRFILGVFAILVSIYLTSFIKTHYYRSLPQRFVIGETLGRKNSKGCDVMIYEYHIDNKRYESRHNCNECYQPKAGVAIIVMIPEGYNDVSRIVPFEFSKQPNNRKTKSPIKGWGEQELKTLFPGIELFCKEVYYFQTYS